MVEILIRNLFFFEVSCRWCSFRIRLAYSHSEISFVGRNEGVNGDIRYSDIVAKTRVNFVSKFNFFCSSSRDPSDYMRFIPLKCHLFSVKRGK